MSSGPLASVVQHLRRLADDGQTDAELLEQFVVHHDAAAFEALVRRHERLVRGVCRRVLRNAEDAFQASFVVLARKAGSIGRRAALAGWLHRVAFRVALRLRAQAAARKAQPLPEAEVPAAAGHPLPRRPGPPRGSRDRRARRTGAAGRHGARASAERLLRGAVLRVGRETGFSLTRPGRRGTMPRCPCALS